MKNIIFKLMVVVIGALAMITLAVAASNADDFVDKDTMVKCPAGMCGEMHACPDLYAMGGASYDDSNYYVCRFVGPVTEEYFENNLVAFDMLACKPGFVVTGLFKAGKPVLRCAKPLNPPSKGVMARGNECRGSTNKYAAVMLGYRQDKNTMACAMIKRGE